MRLYYTQQSPSGSRWCKLCSSESHASSGLSIREGFFVSWDKLESPFGRIRGWRENFLILNREFLTQHEYARLSDSKHVEDKYEH